MITLRLGVDDVNTIYKALEYAKNDPASEPMKRVRVMEGVKEATEKDLSSWDGYVVNEVNSVLEVYLPEASSGNIGINYKHPMVPGELEGETEEDSNKALSVTISIVFDFDEPILIK